MTDENHRLLRELAAREWRQDHPEELAALLDERDRLAARVEELEARVDGVARLLNDSNYRETMEAWVRGIEAGTWDPTANTKRVVASLLRAFFLSFPDPAEREASDG